MNLSWVQQAVIFILGGGGAAAVFTLVKAWLAVRHSADTREATAIANLERWRIEADRRANRAFAELDYERDLRAYWQRRSASAEHLLVVNGIPLPPEPAKPIRTPEPKKGSDSLPQKLGE